MSIDGGLGKLFQDYLPKFDWQRIESGGTGGGIPDLNFCLNGIEGWIENKRVICGEKIKFQPEQIGWNLRRIRHGGRCFIAVRYIIPAGPRRGAAVDRIRLFYGRDVKRLYLNASEVKPIIQGDNGPERWPWRDISDIILYEKML